MSFYRFNDTVTLYTPSGGMFMHHVIDATKVCIVNGDNVEDTKVTVYIPLYSRRSLKYLPPSKMYKLTKRTFTAVTGQKLVIGVCKDDYPPDDSFEVRQVETHTTGSHHVQHIKIIAYNIPTKEEEVPDDETNNNYDSGYGDGYDDGYNAGYNDGFSDAVGE